ncbi:hypothetical protein [Parabacteroides distasonis]|uniref:hypothetical protein n=1 Tax=Parabacteroides distasonis TaxID=823 RepID=UPI00189FB453|nr:hypothetical protein [Parabacteroides distasonis]MDB9154349.1 hypothetical protein [Parabacteroides distasonis]MDB9158891.1 hypothetical protein [Parabacteroides distasonis]MDB9167679.1 hypothetical protein [Parabacteroides distasonis]MDB9172208.1 hypothetical protein [Parabacteroides distasonis]MDB9195903.1 hypothetical protein [Parabacteroides distasonis]
MKDEGYIPSPEIMNKVKGSASAPTLIAVQKIFGMPSVTPGLNDIKLAQNNKHNLGLSTENKVTRNYNIFRK